MSHGDGGNVLRPIIGAALAVLFYGLVRGGLLGVSAGPSQLSPFGIAGFAGLVGFLSKQAADKLDDVFTSLFAPSNQGNPHPGVPARVAAIESHPDPLRVGAPDPTVRVTGSGFVDGSVVRVNGQDRETIFVSASSLQAALAPADIQAPGALHVTVRNPAPNAGETEPVELRVVE